MEEGKRLEGKEATHYTHEADKFRTVVFGMQDGLIGVGSIALGVAGYSTDPLAVVATGLIATVAQAFSMGLGEFISTRVRNQIIDREIRKEMREIEELPQKEMEELVGMYMKKGFNEGEAREISRRLMENKKVVLKEMMMEELKVNPEEFESPYKLGFLMALYLVVGGLIPLSPFLLGHFVRFSFLYEIISSVVLTLSTLGIFGVLGTKYTGLPKWRGSMEQVIVGLLALMGSYYAGQLISTLLPSSQLNIL